MNHFTCRIRARGIRHSAGTPRICILTTSSAKNGAPEDVHAGRHERTNDRTTMPAYRGWLHRSQLLLRNRKPRVLKFKGDSFGTARLRGVAGRLRATRATFTQIRWFLKYREADRRYDFNYPSSACSCICNVYILPKSYDAITSFHRIHHLFYFCLFVLTFF